MQTTVREINGLHVVEGDLSGSPLWNADIAPTSLAQRTWVLLHESPNGGWGVAGHANTGEDLTALARKEIIAASAPKK